MFICQKCKKVVGLGISANRVVTKTIVVSHPRREYNLKGNKVYDPGGQGTQIISEELRCPECSKE